MWLNSCQNSIAELSLRTTWHINTTCCMRWALDVLSVICTRLCPGHFTIRIGNSCSEEIVIQALDQKHNHMLLRSITDHHMLKQTMHTVTNTDPYTQTCNKKLPQRQRQNEDSEYNSSVLDSFSKPTREQNIKFMHLSTGCSKYQSAKKTLHGHNMMPWSYLTDLPQLKAQVTWSSCTVLIFETIMFHYSNPALVFLLFCFCFLNSCLAPILLML